MQYQVPQFIDVEDKIFGPLTFKQFVYVAGAGGIAFVLYKALPIMLALLFGVPIVGLGIALAFYKINNKPFISVLESATKYTTKGKLYVWKKRDRKPGKNTEALPTSVEQIQLPRLSDSKLKDIAWSLGVKDSVYANESRDNNKQNG